MPQTPISATTPYCTATQALDYCDFRTLAQLLSDTTVPLADAAAVIASSRFNKFLLTASGYIESAALNGERYTAADLAALNTAAGGGAALLQQLTAKLAEGLIIQRRPDKTLPLPSEWDAIVGPGGWLDQLASGKRIFGFQETADAGHMDMEQVTESDLQDRHGSVFQARRYWGRRAEDWQ